MNNFIDGDISVLKTSKARTQNIRNRSSDKNTSDLCPRENKNVQNVCDTVSFCFWGYVLFPKGI
jgi:hypothetical protein